MSSKLDDDKLLQTIKEKVQKGNLHNISRTVFYEQFYSDNKEIIWGYLASGVSRNAGWNMTDLEGELIKNLLPKAHRELLYLTYERANWLIFSDAFPQLLLYKASKQKGRPLFYLLKYFHVSKFMEIEWNRFWLERDIWRLCTALIINEQHVIQKPVIEDPFFHDKVFSSLPFVIEDRMHFSTVIFPTLEGKLYGYSVHGFKKVKKRIELGKRLAWLLFFSNERNQIRDFASKVEHTGSRYDYEQFVPRIKGKRTPNIKDTFPIIAHHRGPSSDWYTQKDARTINLYFQKPKVIEKYDLSKWYYKKQSQLEVALKIEQKLLNILPLLKGRLDT